MFFASVLWAMIADNYFNWQPYGAALATRGADGGHCSGGRGAVENSFRFDAAILPATYRCRSATSSAPFVETLCRRYWTDHLFQHRPPYHARSNAVTVAASLCEARGPSPSRTLNRAFQRGAEKGKRWRGCSPGFIRANVSVRSYANILPVAASVRSCRCPRRF